MNPCVVQDFSSCFREPLSGFINNEVIFQSVVGQYVSEKSLNGAFDVLCNHRVTFLSAKTDEVEFVRVRW